MRLNEDGILKIRIKWEGTHKDAPGVMVSARMGLDSGIPATDRGGRQTASISGTMPDL